VIVAGGLLGPGLGLKSALLAILVGGLVGNAMLGLAGLIGAERRVPAMVLLREPLGTKGSYVPTVLNVAQNLGWATFELIVIATAAGALSGRVFGFHGRWLWTLVFAAVTVAFALLGPIRFVRRWVRRFALWVVLASLVYLTWWTLDGADLSALWSQPGDGSLTFAQGVDLTVAMAASWLPLAADYTRFARRGKSAFWGSALGYFVPNVWLYALGVLLLLSHDLGDAAAIVPAVATGGVASAAALLALTVDETDEPFANVYSAAVSLQNMLPNVSQRLLIVLCAGIATLGALVIDLVRYADFLFLLGSFFVPLFGVLAADFVLGARGPAAFRPSGLLAWAAGFALYQYVQPTGPSWWTSHLEWAGRWPIGASLPAFALAFGLTALARYVESRRAAGSPRREPRARPS
jgi:putative hydroxymethylpyrimidine transporter CytX